MKYSKTKKKVYLIKTIIHFWNSSFCLLTDGDIGEDVICCMKPCDPVLYQTNWISPSKYASLFISANFLNLPTKDEMLSCSNAKDIPPVFPTNCWRRTTRWYMNVFQQETYWRDVKFSTFPIRTYFGWVGCQCFNVL